MPAASAGLTALPPPLVAPPLVAPPLVARPLVAAPVARPALASAKPGSAGKALRGLGALVTAPGIPGTKKLRVASAVAETRVNIKPDASNLMQTAKAPRPAGASLGSRTAAQRGKPKHLGLILTGLLLLFLALIAAWSSFSLASWQGDTPKVEIAGTSATPTSDIPAPEDEMLADMQDPADFPPAEDAGAAIDLPLETQIAEAETAEAETAEVETTDAIAVAEPAPNPEIASAAGLEASTPGAVQDEIFLATADAPPSPPDPLSLPQPDARGDPLPTAQLAPPPFGTIYQFDADGLIRPTPEGIITPEGVLLIAGRPPLVPPLRPATAAPLPDIAAAPVLPQPDAVETFAADPALANARPRTRPVTLVPLAPAADDGAALAPGAGSRLAGLKPRARPASVADAAILNAGDANAGGAARLASAAASLTAQAEAAAVVASAGTAQAVAISRIPAPRPRDLSRAVEAAVAAAVRQPDPAPEPAPEVTEAAANTAPQSGDQTGEDHEPEIATAMPKLPTRASVAKQATFKNAINLAKINLIGVYGTKASRYALIRQTNGRYKKVKVGDSLDGGRVAAITASEVRYQKGKKMHTLAMPNG